MKKFKKLFDVNNFRKILFRIFVGIIAFSLIGYIFSLIFPRKNNPSPYPDTTPAVDKLTYWSDKNGTVAKDIEFIRDSDYKCEFIEEYFQYGLLPKITKISNNGWNLLLLNKNNILPTNYEVNLKQITGTSIRLESPVVDAFNSMYFDATKVGLALTPYSGYRTFESQRRLFENKIYALEVEAAGEYANGGSYDAQGNYIEPVKKDIKTIVNEAASYVCMPGCSDHNAGLSIDIVSQNDDFEQSEEYKWLCQNAHNYGFVLRYPSDKEKITGMHFQPYCWRFVGINAAKEMKEKNLCLEEYLSSVLK